MLVRNGKLIVRDDKHSDYTWFQNCQWSLAFCQRCRKLVGWHFTCLAASQQGMCVAFDSQPCPDTFDALIVDALQYKDREYLIFAAVFFSNFFFFGSLVKNRKQVLAVLLRG
jgi:hypothetical protein